MFAGGCTTPSELERFVVMNPRVSDPCGSVPPLPQDVDGSSSRERLCWGSRGAVECADFAALYSRGRDRALQRDFVSTRRPSAYSQGDRLARPLRSTCSPEDLTGGLARPSRARPFPLPPFVPLCETISRRQTCMPSSLPRLGQKPRKDACSNVAGRCQQGEAREPDAHGE